jgi:ribosomal protein S21
MSWNVIVVIDDRMPLERALVKLKKALAMNGTFAAMKRHEHYVKPSLARRRKSLRARAKLAKFARRKETFESRD